jgi:predicted small secreted protein
MSKLTTDILGCAAAVLTAVLIGGCGTFAGAGDSAVQNLEQGAEGRGRLVSPDEMGNEFGSYYD